MCSCTSSTNHDRRTCTCACHPAQHAKVEPYDYLADFRSRLLAAEKALRELAQSDPNAEIKARLNGKAEGVYLALSYFDEIKRVQS